LSSLQVLGHTSGAEPRKIRILVAKPGLDGHDRGALVLSRAFRDSGMEVIYSGLLPTPEQVAQMAVDEDVDVVALSLLNGAHMTAFPKVVRFLKEKGGMDILVIGGGIIPDSDKPKLEKMGIRGNFGPGTSLKTIVDFIKKSVEENRERIAKRSTSAVSGTRSKSKKSVKRSKHPR
jgi:methylmalonyl-CoA mutase C-terminal domain/subunit